MENVLLILGAIFGSGAFFTFLQFLINRHDVRRGITAQNYTRTQLMLLMAVYPDKVDEILEQAKFYFCKLNGNTYIIGLFVDWLNKKKMDKPDWFVEYLKKKGELKWLES